MAYVPTSWTDNAAPPLNAANLNKIENGIDAAHGLAAAAHAAADAVAERFMTGLGSPVGVVAAEPGTKYLDEVGTTGAWEWIKTAGVDTSGWQVSYGDTGWRTLLEYDGSGAHVYGATLPPDWVPRATGRATLVQVRRISNEVSYFIQDVAAGVDNPSGRIFDTTSIPGFVPSQQTAIRPLYMSGSIVGMSNTLARPGAQTITAGAYFYAVELSFLTSNDWPTTLPGKSA